MTLYGFFLMGSFATELLVVLVLSLLNGIFSMSELAVMSANRGRLLAKASQGNRGAKVALELIENSSQFLATVQVGITFIGIIAGVFGGATLAEDLAFLLNAWGVGHKLADTLAFVTVVTGITYLSLVLGELVPKQIALSYPETVASIVSRPLLVVSRICRPLVWVLEGSSKIAIKSLPFNVGERKEVSMDDIHHLINEGEKEGELRRSEKDMAFRVFKLDDRPISAFMTVRPDVVWFDITKPILEIWDLAIKVPHSYFPVAEGTIDNIIGILSVKDLWSVITSHEGIQIRDKVRPALTVLETRDALSVLEQFKKERRQVALVIDPNGSIAGMVTTHDLLEAIVGDLADYEGEERSIVPRSDGSILVDAIVNIHEVFLHFKLDHKDDSATSDGYHSVGGILFKELGRIPSVGDTLDFEGLRFEIVDMDKHRIDKVLISRSS